MYNTRRTSCSLFTMHTSLFTMSYLLFTIHYHISYCIIMYNMFRFYMALYRMACHDMIRCHTIWCQVISCHTIWFNFTLSCIMLHYLILPYYIVWCNSTATRTTALVALLVVGLCIKLWPCFSRSLFNNRMEGARTKNQAWPQG